MKNQQDKAGGSTSKGLSRRGVLQGIGGAAALVALTPKTAMLWAEELGPKAAGEGLASGLPGLGALFNPYHHPEDWSLLSRGLPEGMPLLGAYSSDAVGAAVTQIIWAKQAGMQFFLASYCPGRPKEGVDALFEAARRTDFEIALLIDVGDAAGASRSRSKEARLAAGLSQITTSFLSEKSYLRDGSGSPLLAVAGLDDGTALGPALAAAGKSLRGGSVLRLPSAWRQVADREVEPDLAEATEVHGLYAGYSARSGRAPEARSIPSHGKQTSALLVSPVRDGKLGLSLPPSAVIAEGSRASWVILDSFNNWGVSVPLEPGTKSTTRYARQVAAWSGRQEA